MPELDFYFDPVCPFAWLTSKWVRLVASQREMEVGWRFISLRLINRDVDYSTHFPLGYEEGHTTGLRLLRVAAAVRQSDGNDAVDGFYERVGESLFERRHGQADAQADLPAFTLSMLRAVGLPDHLADALDDSAHDDLIGAETENALALTGRDVGTPVLHFSPPDGTAFFGPVISRLPDPASALRLWDHVTGLASFAGFAELKRSLREVPQLAAFGVQPGDASAEHDWHQGRRPDALTDPV